MTIEGNLFSDFETALPALGEEITETLLSCAGVRIERIVSHAAASPDGFWYDQGQDEWVTVLRGAADLVFADETVPRRLGPGDYVLIPAHRRHRVASTAADEPTLWLAVHMPPGNRSA